LNKRRIHRPEFKAKVAMEAISGRKTIQEIASDHSIHPIPSHHQAAVSLRCK
jgi:putative transposase